MPIKTKVPWFEAESKCQDLGGHLASATLLKLNSLFSGKFSENLFLQPKKSTLYQLTRH